MGTRSPAARRSTSAHRLRAWAALGVIALTLPVVSGCAAGLGAQTNKVYQPSEGVSDRDGDVYAINTLVVTDGNGNGTVVSALINQAPDDDTLNGFTAESAAGVPIKASPLPGGGIALPSQKAVQLANLGELRVSDKSLMAGTLVTLKFGFAHAQPVDLEVPVVAQTSVYADVPVGPTSNAKG